MADKKNVTDLRGAGKLTIDVVTGITDLVEDLHQTISSMGGLLSAPDQQRAKGIAGMVYRNVRAVSELVGRGVDALLRRLGAQLGEKESTPAREAVVAALNGVLGDHMAATDNPLAISMQLRRNSETIEIDDPDFSKMIFESGGKLAIMVHGSCMNDLQWNRQEHDHGAALANDLGYLPVYLYYNSGLHVSENGRMFSGLLESLLNQLAPSVELVIIAHSMGGLVSRSACHYGGKAGHTWLTRLRKLIFLGTPHHGAPLERGGNRIDVLLRVSPYSAPFFRLGKVRSAGVTDLRYGNVLDEDWSDRDRFEPSGDHRVAVPLPKGVQCYAIAAVLASEAGKLGPKLIGDGLVPLDSALGRHKKTDMTLLFPASNQWVGHDMGHLDLLNQPAVYEKIKQYLTDS